MFATFKTPPPVLMARIISCCHCGFEIRHGLKPSVLKTSGKAERRRTPSSVPCPRCSARADINSRPSSGRIVDVYSHLPPSPFFSSRKLARTCASLRTPMLYGLALCALALLVPPAMATAVTRAMDHETTARSQYASAADPEGFCDARIRAYRHAPPSHAAWQALAESCPARTDIIATFRQSAEERETG